MKLLVSHSLTYLLSRYPRHHFGLYYQNKASHRKFLNGIYVLLIKIDCIGYFSFCVKCLRKFKIIFMCCITFHFFLCVRFSVYKFFLTDCIFVCSSLSLFVNDFAPINSLSLLIEFSTFFHDINYFINACLILSCLLCQ